MSLIKLLQEWYETNCKSKNCVGIQIETTENCDWKVVIDLFDTDFETKNFQTIDIHKDNSNWVHCTKENDIFRGYGGIKNLEDILNIFYKWVND